MRLGVIGYGNRIHGVINGAFRQVDPQVRVVGVVDPDEQGVRQRLAPCDRDHTVFYKNVDQLIRQGKVDALAIGTRCNLHSRFAIQIAAYDLPLFLEKPVATSMRQANDLERAFAKSRCSVVVSFPLRISPLCTLARRYIEDQAIGTPIHIAALNYVPYGTIYWESAYRDYQITGGLFLQKATHDFDYMSYLMDSPIVRVGAMQTSGQVFGGDKPAGLYCSQCNEQETCLESPQNRQRNQTTGTKSDHLCLYSKECGIPGTDLNEDCSSTVVEFASGAHGVYTQVFFSRRDAAARGAIISGYMGTINFDWYTNELKRVRHHAPFSTSEHAGAGASHFGGDLELAYNFIAVVQGKSSSHTPLETGLQSVYTCLAARQSSTRKNFVKVKQVGS